MLFLVDSCIPARQWTDICNKRCSILSRFSHFHVSHFQRPLFDVCHFGAIWTYYYYYCHSLSHLLTGLTVCHVTDGRQEAAVCSGLTESCYSEFVCQHNNRVARSHRCLKPVRAPICHYEDPHYECRRLSPSHLHV